MLHYAGQKRVGEDHLRAPTHAAIEDLLRERPSKTPLEVMLRMESGVGGPDGLDPPLERELLPVRLVNLEPRPVDGFFGVQYQPIEIENQGSDHGSKA
jgi:hypothetical protein